MADLSAKILAARRRWVEAGGYGFEIQRPTEYDLAELRARRPKDKILGMVELVKAHVVGWRGIKESDLVPGGSEDAPAFGAELFAAFIEDRPKLWAPLAQAIWDSVQEHERELEKLRGN